MAKLTPTQWKILKEYLHDERTVQHSLRKQYQAAEYEINKKIKAFQQDIDIQKQALANSTDATEQALIQSQINSKIYQKQYQEALKKQIGTILDTLHSQNFDTIDAYLKGCYESGYISTMYDLMNQGIPIMMPIDQRQVVNSLIHNTKLSKPLYESLGYNVGELKKQVNSEISRGIASALSSADIARNIRRRTSVTFNYSMRIARTEGHRVSQEASLHAQHVAKSKGADVVKQWCSILDSRTRPSHRIVDGEIRDLDEKFSNGLLMPGDPEGIAKEVINCRCVLLQRAKWALDEDELQTLKDRAEYFKLDKSDSFEEFRRKYLDNVTDE